MTKRSDRMDRHNRYKVPKRQWRKWCDLSRLTFNEVYGMMVLNQKLFLHPETAKAPKKRWKTTCWNAAWTAAGGVKHGLNDIVKHG